MEVSENKWKGLQDGSLGQFTGFYDADDNEIYEGDIVRFTDPATKMEHFFEVAFDRGFFGLKNNAVTKQFTPLSCHIMTRYTVAGNIHDNADMLN